MAFLNMAIDYRAAANDLLTFRQSQARTTQRPGADDPIYFLYFQTAELALKAFLRSHDIPIAGTDYGRKHELVKLYEHCKLLGLIVGPGDDRFDIGNVVELLDDGNERSGFRYFNATSRWLPNLNWAGRTVGMLVDTVAAVVRQRDPDAEKPGPAVAARVTIDMSVRQ